MAPIIEDLPQIPPEQKTRIQQVLGTLLFYARVSDPTMLLAVNAIACQQEHPTEKRKQQL
eukprot:466210-Ditylum_brightwellii.AAC.1